MASSTPIDDDLSSLFTLTTSDYVTNHYNLHVKALKTTLPVSLLSSPAASTDFDDTGSVVWPVSVLLSQYVVNYYYEEYISASKDSSPPSLLELGSGVGLPSLSLLTLSSQNPLLPLPSLIATDGRSNYVDPNDGVLTKNVGGKGGRVKKVVWGNKGDVEGLVGMTREGEGFDFIYMADVLQWPAVVEPLARTVRRCCKMGGRIAVGIVERDGGGCRETFWRLMKRFGFRDVQIVDPSTYLALDETSGEVVYPEGGEEMGGRICKIWTAVRMDEDDEGEEGGEMGGEVGGGWDESQGLPC